MVVPLLWSGSHKQVHHVRRPAIRDKGPLKNSPQPGVYCLIIVQCVTSCIAHMRMLLYIFLLSSLVSHFLVSPCALDDRVNLI